MKRRRIGIPLGLRARIIGVFVVVVLIVGLGTAGAVAWAVQRWIYSNAQSVALSQFETEIDGALQTRDGSGAATTFSGLRPDVQLVVNGTTAQLGAAGLNHDVDPGFRQRVRSTEGSISYRRVGGTTLLVGRVANVGSATVEFYALRPLPGVRDKLTQLLAIVVLSLAIALTLATVIGAWLATVLLRPLQRLNDAAARAAAGDLTVRLESSGVPELAEVTSTFNAMVEQHNASLQQSRRFVGDVTHELRTPLAALVPIAEILGEESGNLPGDSAAAADIAAVEITRLVRLVEDLIEISRHDVNTATLKLETVDVVQLITDSIAMRGWQDLVAVYAPDTLVTQVDPRRIDICVSNLIGNALRHGAPPVDVTLAARGRTVEIRVHDRGAGIPAEHVDKIFDRFYKADAARTRSEGSGLGLSLVREYVRLHHGTIGVSSLPGSTIFRIQLPLLAAESVPPAG